MNKLKKPVSLLLTLLLLLSVAAVAPVSVSADDTTVYTEGNYEYTVSKKKATIVKYIGHAKKVVVPSALGGYPVTCIGHFDSEGLSIYNDEGSYSNNLRNGYDSYYGRYADKGAFYNCKTIESITIPGSVKTIGFYAFRYCDNLSDVKINYGVENIYTYAFDLCPSLTKITLPDSIKLVAPYAFTVSKNYWGDGVHRGIKELTLNTDCTFDFLSIEDTLEDLTITFGTNRIPDNAFKGFSHIKTLSIPNTVTYIGESAFEQSFSSELTSLDIPSSVQFIGKKAFRDCRNLEEVMLHKGLKSIGEGAFKQCYALRHVILPRTLQVLENSAFFGCENLTGIDIPGSVSVIGESAFEYCHQLGTVIIHRGVTTIGSRAFHKDDGVTYLSQYEENIDNRSDQNGALNIYIPMSVANINGNRTICSPNYDHTESLYGTQLVGYKVWYTNDVVIHAPEASTGEVYAEANDIPWIKTADGDEVFNDYKDEDDLAAEAEAGGGGADPMGDANTLIGICGGTDVIKEYLSEDLNLNIPSEIEEDSPVTTIAANAFRNLDINSISFPDSLEDIGPWAFSGCKQLGKAVLKQGVKQIAEYALSNCPNLSEIELPDSLTELGDAVFSGCKKLREIELPEELTALGKAVLEECSSLREIEIPENIRNLASELLSNCTNLSEIDLPSELRSIGDKAIASCKSLIEIELPNTLKEIKDSVFSDCINLDGLELPEGLTELGDAVFSGCDSLTEIEMPDSIKSLGDAAFENCKNLENVELSEEITEIGDYTFNNCSSLEDIEIPEGVTSIGIEAFSDCESLTSAIIPATVTSISADAFDGCDNLVISGYLNSFVEDFAEANDIPFIAYTVEGAKAAIKGYSVPDTLAKIVVSSEFYDNAVTAIGDEVFSNLTALTDIELPDTIVNIGKDAFKGCTNLDSITLPDCIKVIEDSAFQNCTDLTQLVIPSGAETLAQNAFEGCADLEEAYIWGRETVLEKDVFKSCSDALTIFGYDSSPADAYAALKDVDFIPLLNTNEGGSYKDLPLTALQTALNDGNTFGLDEDFYGNIEFLGIQQKDDQGCGIRFVGVINEGIVAEATRAHDVVDYGFVVAKCSKSSTAAASEENIKTITADSANALTLSCKKTSNQICGDYGVYNADTQYKYVTLAVNNVDPGQGLVARFYVKTDSGRVYYANYGEDHTGCVTDYNRIAAMSGGDNSVLIKDDWDRMTTLSDD